MTKRQKLYDDYIQVRITPDTGAELESRADEMCIPTGALARVLLIHILSYMRREKIDALQFLSRMGRVEPSPPAPADYEPARDRRISRARPEPVDGPPRELTEDEKDALARRERDLRTYGVERGKRPNRRRT